MHFQPILEAIVEDVRPLTSQGKVASYIPALARVPADQVGMALCTVDGQEAAAGSAMLPFSIQSISTGEHQRVDESGVGGGIIAVLPDRLSLCVWSPGLGPSGNSVAGMHALELFVERTGLSVF